MSSPHHMFIRLLCPRYDRLDGWKLFGFATGRNLHRVLPGSSLFWRSTGCRMSSYEFGSQQSHQLVSTNVFLQGACTASSGLFVKSNAQHLSLRSGLLWSSQLSMWNWYCDMWAHCHLDRLRIVGTLCTTGGAENQQKPGWFWILLGDFECERKPFFFLNVFNIDIYDISLSP